MLKIGEIVKGSQFPETVEIKKCEQIDDLFYIIEALGRQTKNYYELMLENKDIQALERLSITNSSESMITAHDLQHFLQGWAFEVNERFSFSRALGGRNLLPLPHQIEAVYSRMVQVPQIRFLLADDPGAGKTIMSGMLIRELKARQNAERVLILVPPFVLKQWQEELEEKFNLQFVIINRQILKAGGKNPFVENDHCLTSMYWAARDDIKSFINEADFDLIIVDEAHKMAAYTHGKLKKKISRTKLYQLGEMLLRQTNHCLLLTATPHKGDVENFRHLMSLLDHDIFSNVAANESLKEKSNPFIIRRLKENLKNFDGTPLFPKRTTKTIEYTLSDRELELYEAVTNYVRYYFNRAINKGNNSTAFAMMLLQRRLSSSIEAIYLSLQRRHEKLSHLLVQTKEEREKYLRQLRELDFSEFDDEALEYQQEIEEKLEQAIDTIDPDELQVELDELDKLISKASYLCLNTVERKYQELEATLFGVNGVLNQGEKILIFTESTDTLNYLERCLLERVPRIAKIIGRFSMDERRRQVEFFRRNEGQIMLATDAGGEAINLQFCNQSINYDIPWNPNKLEQRMGRIHRIGQKNEVFVFNLVAKNTREGDVMIRLLDKMELMRKDLGTDLVYDFIGEILEDNYCDLPTLMQEAILNRENLDDIIAKMDKTLSKEHEKLIEFVEKERVDETSVDLPSMRREQYDLVVKRIPTRNYTAFSQRILNKKKIRIYESSEEKVKRVERLPKFIRDFARKKKIKLKSTAEAYRFTGYSDYEAKEVELMFYDHPLFKLALELTKQESEKFALERYMLPYPTPESLSVEVYGVGVADGTGRELTKELIFLAKRQEQAIIALDPYWLFQGEFEGDCIKLAENTATTLAAALRATAKVRESIREKRDAQLNKISVFLKRAFELQYNNTLEKLTAYQKDNKDNRNSALINQMNAALIDIEVRREERLTEVERQRNIIMKPPKRLLQLELMPNGKGCRLFAVDYREIVEQYEHKNGRHNVKMFDAFALVDFYSERYNGEPRFIIISDFHKYTLTEDYLEDLRDILDKSYVYIVRDGRIVEERALNELTLF